MSYIEFQNIKKSYDNKTNVLDDINLTVEKGQLLTLLGPSGCGKSTLLRCIAGFNSIEGGTIKINGKIMNDLAPGDRNVGMVFQAYSLFPNMNVRDNIGFGLKMKKIKTSSIMEKVDHMIEIVGLRGKEKYYPSDLSGGQKQRVALARALVTEPQVLLLDEPLSAIDAQLRKSLQQSIRDIQQRLNITTIFVTHDQNESMIMSDRIAILNQGRIEQVDTPINLYTKPRTEFVANFLGNYNVIQAQDYTDMTGEYCPSTVAIRPEAILIQDQAPTLDSETHVVVQGRVKERVPQGNILAYKIDVQGHQLKVDSLFRTHNLYEPGQTVFASFERRNILSLEG